MKLSQHPFFPPFCQYESWVKLHLWLYSDIISNDLFTLLWPIIILLWFSMFVYQNAIMGLCQDGRACCAWYYLESRCRISTVASTICSICYPLPWLYWVLISQFDKILLNTLRHRCWNTSWKRKKLNLASGRATHCEQNQQRIGIHEYISSGHYCAVTDPLIPVSSLLSLSDADEKCSVFRSPQHYHSVFSTCYQMTPKCWLRMINVVLVNTSFTLTFYV